MDYQFSKMMGNFKSSAVRDILKLTQGKSIVSFAGGLPAEELFPIDAVREARNADATEAELDQRESVCPFAEDGEGRLDRGDEPGGRAVRALGVPCRRGRELRQGDGADPNPKAHRNWARSRAITSAASVPSSGLASTS